MAVAYHEAWFNDGAEVREVDVAYPVGPVDQAQDALEFALGN